MLSPHTSPCKLLLSLSFPAQMSSPQRSLPWLPLPQYSRKSPGCLVCSHCSPVPRVTYRPACTTTTFNEQVPWVILQRKNWGPENRSDLLKVTQQTSGCSRTRGWEKMVPLISLWAITVCHASELRCLSKPFCHQGELGSKASYNTVPKPHGLSQACGHMHRWACRPFCPLTKQVPEQHRWGMCKD